MDISKDDVSQEVVPFHLHIVNDKTIVEVTDKFSARISIHAFNLWARIFR